MKPLIAILIALATAIPATAQDAKTQAASWIAYCCTAAPSLPVDIVPETQQPTPKPKVDYSKPVSYEVAHAAYTEEQRPMVVMLTWSRCGPCQVDKPILKGMLSDGEMGNASLALVSWDDTPNRCREIARTSRVTFPQYHVFYFDENGKPRRRQVGSIESIPAILGTR